MSRVDVQKYLEPISESAPCGANLEYDPVFFKLSAAAEGKPEREMGDVVIPAIPPDWQKVQEFGLNLLERTRDLRVHKELARAALGTGDYPGFRDWLAVIRGSLSAFWESVHPELDKEDDNDPGFRVNVLSGLCDWNATLSLFLEAELARAKGLGKLTLRDVLVTRGERKPADEAEPMNQAQIDAIFKGCELEPLQARAVAVDEALTIVTEIDQILTDKAGSDKACSFEPLVAQLRDVSKILRGGLAARGEAPSGAGPAADSDGPVAAAADGSAASHVLRTREDVVRAIERIISFYEAQEPSSPIPVLLAGARRLATMDFLEIMNVVTPDGLKHLKAIAGFDQKK